MSSYLRFNNLGDLQLNLQGALFFGINSKHGRYRDAQGNLLGSWDLLKFHWPDYKHQTFSLPSITLRGLTLTLPATAPDAKDDSDWLTQLYQALAEPPALPAFHVDDLQIQNAKILSSKGSTILQVQALNATLQAQKQSYALTLEASKLRAPEFEIDHFKANSSWDPHALRIKALDLDAPFGTANLHDLSLDSNKQQLALGKLDLSINNALGTASLKLRAPKGRASGTLHYRQGTEQRVQSSIHGQIANLRALDLKLHSMCDPCGALPLAWQGDIHLQANLVKPSFQAKTELSARDQQLQAKVSLLTPQKLSSELSWQSQDLGKLIATAQGQSVGQARCHLELQTQNLRCHTEIELQDIYPKTRAKGEIEFHWTPTRGLDASIQSLRLHAFDQDVRANPKEARLQLKPDGRFNLKGLTLKTQGAKSSLMINASRTEEKQLIAQVQAKHWELALFSAFVPGLNLRGTLELDLSLEQQQDLFRASLHGKVQRIHWRGLHWGQLQLSARQKKQRLHLRGKLEGGRHARLSFQASLPPRQPKLWSNQARATLSLHRLDKAALAALTGTSDWDGELRGEANFTGSGPSPKLSVDLDWKNPRWRKLRQKQLSLRAQLAPDRLEAKLALKSTSQGRIELKALLPMQTGTIQRPLNWDRTRRLTSTLRIQQFPLNQLSRALDLPKLGGTLNAKFVLEGLAHNPRLQGWASVWQPKYERFQGKEINVSLKHEHQESRLELAAYRNKGQVQAQALIPIHLDLLTPTFAWQSDRRHELELIVDHLDSQLLRKLLPVPPGLLAKASFRAKGSRHNPQGNAKVELSSTNPQLAPFQLIATATLGTRQQGLRVKLTKRGKTRLVARLELNTKAEKILENPSAWTSVPAQLRVRTQQLSLRELEPWLPAGFERPRGILSANVQGQGPLGALRFLGTARVRDGAFTVLAMQQRWSKVDADIHLEGKALTLSSLRAAAGPGKLQAKGLFTLRAPLSGNMDLKLHRIPLSLAGAPDMEATANLAITALADPQAIKIDTEISNAKIEVFERYNASIKDIPSNANIRFASEEIKKTKRTPPQRPFPNFHLSTKLQDPLKVEGQSISTAWTGKLTLVQDGKKTRAKGSLQATPRGSVDLLNNHFVIERAKLDFSASQGLVPFIDLRAQTKVEDEDITVTAQGPADDPTLHFESSSNASKSEILSALVTGNAGGSQDGDNRLLAKAASALIAEHTKGLGQMAKRIGVDNLRVSFGDSLSDTIVSAGTWIRPRVYLESRVRAQAPEGQSRVQGRIRFNFRRNWVLEGYVGDRSSGGGGLWWHRPARTFQAKPTSEDVSTKRPKTKPIDRADPSR